MKCNEFKKLLKEIDDDDEIVFSNDEELNSIKPNGRIDHLDFAGMPTNIYVIYGYGKEL